MAGQSNDLSDVIITIGIAVVVLFISLAMANTIVTTEGVGDTSVSTAAALDGPDQWTRLDESAGTDETVYDSRGYAINLTGADDSYFKSDSTIDYGSGGFSTSVWASVDNPSKNETMAVVSLDGRAVIAYNGTGADEWVGWYYNESSRNSYTVKVDAVGDTGNLHHLVLRANGTHLSMYRNDTDAAHTAFVSRNVKDAPNTTQNWDGRVEELRTFNSALNASVRSSLFSDGVAAQPGTNRTARAMFDQPNKDTQLLFFTSASLTTSNVSYSAGLIGNELVPGSNLLSQSDYGWRTEGPQISPLEGGRLEYAPVAYVDYDKKTAGNLNSFIRQTESIVSMIALLLFVVLAVTVIGYIYGDGAGR